MQLIRNGFSQKIRSQAFDWSARAQTDMQALSNTTGKAWWEDNWPNKLDFPELERKLDCANFYRDDLREMQTQEAIS